MPTILSLLPPEQSLAASLAAPDPLAPPTALAGIPQSADLPFSMTVAGVWGEHPWETQARLETAAMDNWRADSMAKLDRAIDSPDEFFKDDDLSWGEGPDAARREVVNNMFLTIHGMDGTGVPADFLNRALQRQEAAHLFFNGKGGESEAAFHGEVVRHVGKLKAKREAFDFVGQLADAAAVLEVDTPGTAKTYWPALREQLQKQPGYDPADEADYYEGFHQRRMDTRAVMAPFADELAEVWQGWKDSTGAGKVVGIAKAIVGDVLLGTPERGEGDSRTQQAIKAKSTRQTAFEIYDKLAPEDRPKFMAALGALAAAVPKEEKPAFFANIAKQSGRDFESLVQQSVTGAVEFFSNPDNWDTMNATGKPTKYRRQSDFMQQVQNLREGQYDPVKKLSSGWAGQLGETVAYGTPGVLATSLAASNPYTAVGLFSSLKESHYQSLLQGQEAAGIGYEQASAFATRAAPLAALAETGSEMLGASLLRGKLPFLDRALTGAMDGLKNPLVRGAARFVAGGAEEGGLEVGQNYIDSTIRGIANAFGADTGKIVMPSAQENIESFALVLPLALMGIPGAFRNDQRVKAFAAASDLQLGAMGVPQAGIAGIREGISKGLNSGAAAIDAAMETRDPNSPEAAAAVAQLEALTNAQLAAGETLKASGALPDVVVSKEGFQVRDAETREIIGTAPDSAGALRIASAHSAAMDDAAADEVAYWVSSLEGARAAVALDPQSKLSVELDRVMTEAAIAAENPAALDDFHAQQRLRELAGGGDGAVADVALGVSNTDFRERVRETTNRIFRGGSVLTAFHETGHGLRRAAHAAGVLTRADDLAILRAVDSVMDGKAMRHGTDGGRSLRLIPAGVADADVTDKMIDEGISEILEMEVMRTRAGGGKRPEGHGIPSAVNRVAPGIISRNLSALARLAGDKTVGKWKAFSDAVRGLFGLATQRALALRKAERDGLFDTETYDAYLDRLTNTTAQRAYEDEAAGVAGEILGGAAAFSLGPRPDIIKYLDRKGGASDTAADEQVRDPASILETLTAQSDGEGSLRTDGKKRRKHGRIIATVEDLAKWAEKAGRILNPEPIQALEEYPSGGGEHLVIFDPPSGRVIKLTKPGFFGAQGEDAGAYLERWALHNLAFGNDVAFEGMVTFPGEDSPRAVISQPFAMGRDATPEEQREFLMEKGFHEAADGRWIHPIRKIAAWDTITPGNAIMTESGVKFIDLQMAPALADELAKIQNETGIGRKSAFSLAPSAMVSRLNENAISLIRNPRERAAAYQRLSKTLAALRLTFERLELVAGSKRRKASLKKESAIREALRTDELVNEAWGRHGAILSDDDLTRLKAQPVHAHLADPNSKMRGRLMSRGQALRMHPDMFIRARGGEYDGADGISRAVFGGSLLPDQAAQELYDNHLIKEPTPDAMWDAIRREQSFVDNMKEALRKAEDELRDAKTQAKRETNEWLAAQGDTQAAAFSDKQEILRALAVLDGVLAVVPADIRGKVGGYTQLAALGSNETRLEFLKRRLAMVDKEMERWLSAQYDREFRDLLKRTRPAKEKPGEKPKGTIGADLHEVFRAVEASMQWKPAEVEAQALALESLAASGTLTAEEEANAITQANLYRLAGTWEPIHRAVLDASGDPTGETVLEYPGADASRREAAVIEAGRIIETGYWANRLEAARKRADRTATRQRLEAATGKAGTREERRKKAADDAGLKGGAGWLPTIYDLMSFEQVLNFVFGETSADAARFADGERWASDRKTDAIDGQTDALAQLYTDLAGGGLAGSKLAWRMALESIKVRGEGFSEMEAVQATLMWRQEDGRRHMLGHQDDEGNYVGKWHYDQAFMDELESKLSPEAKEVRLFLIERYAAEYARLNPIYRKLNGVNLPQNRFYSPLTVVPVETKPGADIDPVTGFSGGLAFTPGSLKNRSSDAIAEPDFRDAAQTWIAHVKQLEHWMAYAELTQDLQAALGNRDLRSAMEAKAGKEAVNVLSKWVEYFGLGGVRDSGFQLWLNKKLSPLVSRAAGIALIGRAGVLAVQSVQLGAALAEMPTGAFLKRFGMLMGGQLSWIDTMKSDYIQRRLRQLPPAVRMALEGLHASKPNAIKHAMAKVGTMIGAADAFFTAGTYAISLDYHRSQLAKNGVTGPDLEREAHQAAQRSCDRIAQPTRAGARSYYEATATNPLSRLMWAFSSEARQKGSLVLYALANKEVSWDRKARAVAVAWLVGGMITTLIRAAWRDMRDDDDEWLDEKNWGWDRLAFGTLTGPLKAIPAIGDSFTGLVANWSGQYSPNGTLLSMIPDAAIASKRLLWDGPKDFETGLKDAERLLMGLGVFNDTAAALASGSHIVRDVFALVDNALD